LDRRFIVSVLARLKSSVAKRGVFGVVAGTRLSGKSTVAGTLPGNTLLLQAKLIETGSRSAQKLADKLGNSLDIAEFSTLKDLYDVIEELGEDTHYKNIYIDGMSAITELKHDEPEMRKMMKKNVWDAYREIGTSAATILYAAKGLSEETGKNVFFTLALKEKYDSMGNLVNLDPDIKGNMTLGSIKKICPVVVCLRATLDEDGNTVREVLTASEGPFSARVDELIDDENPGVLPADLGKVLNLLNGGSNE